MMGLVRVQSGVQGQLLQQKQNLSLAWASGNQSDASGAKLGNAPSRQGCLQGVHAIRFLGCLGLSAVS